MSNTSKAYLGLCIVLFSTSLPAQTTCIAQFWNELSFTRPLKGKWTGQFDFSQTTSSAAGEGNLFAAYAQFMLKGWAHYHPSSRWKVSAFFAYYQNTDAPEINQEKYPELRFAPQGTYYIKKTRFTLSTSMRIEFRFIKRGEENKYEDAYRYWQQLKIQYPFNSKIVRKGVVYGIGQEEIFVKIPGDVTGQQVFDRMRTTIGAGYSITDNIQVELTYVNDFLPRPELNELYNVIQLNFTFNNLFSNLRKKITGLFQDNNADE